MKSATRTSTTTLILLMLFVSVIVGINVIDSSGYTDLSGLDSFPNTVFFAMVWNELPIQLPLWLGLSVYFQFILYLGGRLKNKRFNDLIPEFLINSNTSLFKTALIRAVLIFLTFGFEQMQQTTIASSRIPQLGGINQ